jgi:hypothetical protein
VEVTFDADKPGHFAIEPIAHEDLWFAPDLTNIHNAPFLVRNCRVTREQVEAFKNVQEEQINLIFKDTNNDEGKVEALHDIQKIFYKNPKDGLIYVAWLEYTNGTDFLREPQPLWHGRLYIHKEGTTGQPAINQVTGQPITSKIYETQYPIEVNCYSVSENDRLVSLKGRAFMDEYVQEACGSLVSSIVNAWHRASQVMGSPTNPVSAGSPEQTDIVIRGGKLYDNPVNFFHMPYPDATGMQIVEQLITANKAETSQVNFAVNNRQDSRKTAREISAAQSQASLLSGVQVTLYSLFLRNVFTRCWNIVKSQWEQGLITMFTPPDKEYLTLDYTLYSAGDTEVVQRDEQLQKLQQSWPVFETTPAAPIILQAIVDLAFPLMAEKINKALEGTNPANIVASLDQVVKGFMQQYGSQLQPQQIQQLKAVLLEADTYMQHNQPTQQGKPHGKPVEQPAANAS